MCLIDCDLQTGGEMVDVPIPFARLPTLDGLGHQQEGRRHGSGWPGCQMARSMQRHQKGASVGGQRRPHQLESLQSAWQCSRMGSVLMGRLEGQMHSKCMQSPWQMFQNFENALPLKLVKFEASAFEITFPLPTDGLSTC